MSGTSRTSAATMGERVVDDLRPHAGRAVLSRRAPELRREPAAPHAMTGRRSSSAARTGRQRSMLSATSCTAAVGAFRGRRCATQGVGAGDRVAGFIPNMPEAIVAALGAAAVGAVWSSCSPDFGVQGVLDRFGQIEPSVLVAADGYFYGGKTHDSLRADRGRSLDALPTVERRRSSSRIVGDAAATSTACARPRCGATSSAPAPRELALRAAAVQPSALHPVFVGHDRRSQVHRARRRRHADPAPQGAPAPLRHQAPAIASSTSRPAAG